MNMRVDNGVKVYLAAMYQWMERMAVERARFRAAGFVCTSQWIDNGEEEVAIKTRHDAAQMDLDDIDLADALVLYTLDHGTMFTSGGRMVELGYALAKNKGVFIIGDRENVFCHLNQVVICKDTYDAIAKLKIYSEQRSKPPMSLMERQSLAMAAFDDVLKTPIVGYTET